MRLTGKERVVVIGGKETAELPVEVVKGSIAAMDAMAKALRRFLDLHWAAEAREAEEQRLRECRMVGQITTELPQRDSCPCGACVEARAALAMLTVKA